ncbi:short chain dehydrogenase [Pantoea agglomerans]|uniref:Short chain dehydrogenase n=1 Tax=Enterobacter agglomerans TaxID=549 RepID=A0A379AHW1_ENTAG|nr:short chain dehydrogenase [Pantoea agglomerans]
MSGEYDVNLRYGVDTTMNLAGKVAVVTGGLGGIAMATNGMLLEKGARVWHYSIRRLKQRRWPA